MNMPMPASAAIAMAALLLLSVLSCVRIGYWQWRAGPTQRARHWRVALLLLLQPLLAGLLYLALFPPDIATRAGHMRVSTAHADAVQSSSRDTGAGEVRVALPEAGPDSAAKRFPDLASALRAYPGTSSISVVGDGLIARDRDGWQPLSLQLQVPPLPNGIDALQLPPALAAGGRFVVSGHASTRAAAVLQLRDPGGHLVDRQTLPRSGHFQLHGVARSTGRMLFELRLLDDKGQRIEQLPVPLQVLPYRQPRVLLLAGAANPELKYLRRWASDAGIDLQVRIDAGGGAQLGDATVRVDREGLKAFDLLIIDDRAWSQLGAGARAAINQAVSEGMGLLLRATAALTAAQRQQWQALGLPVTGNGAVIDRVRLAPDADMATTDDAANSAAQASSLSVRRLRLPSDDSVPLLAGDKGQVLAAWRAHGQGRVALWPLSDTFTLVLAGHGDRHARLWSEALSTLARVDKSQASAAANEPIWQGDRIALCQLGDDARITDPTGAATRLLIDPVTGTRRCAGYWPQQAGWHVLRQGKDEQALFVYPADSGTTLQRARVQQASAQLASLPAAAATAGAGKPQPGNPWPWWLAWLLLAALGWWFERSRFGRRLPQS
ncbi:hypothetical protein [Pseudoxanthomonas dokdonensis]|uniref:Carboxypeptidase regulatory-like domain-containing protein n=1 Tax=Pseudoxanthomonas dokdonensis TaxID=344882 RepID=A0A0R0D241_9GAMM|nr:hypothetical protein [Pseudoxanthomonas dokdonensis]KRG72020.1 hypothetical protein ABB29_00720 [Pseudoxanthomonas dokdonensis]